jgi:hypothetical protein
MQQLIVSALFSSLVLILCVLRPNAGRVFLGLFFMVMAIGVNVVLVVIDPDLFVGLGTNDAIVPLYRWFFENVVALAPPLFGLLAAAYEVAIALLMLSKGRYAKWGLIGGIVFLIGITPVGVWTLANPLLALAMAFSRRVQARTDANPCDLIHAIFGRPSTFRDCWLYPTGGVGYSLLAAQSFA